VVATSSVAVLRAIAGALDARAAEALLAALGVEPARLEDLDARVPFADVLRAWELAPRLAGDDAFGLHLAQRAPAGAFDVLDYVTRSAGTLGGAFDALARYQRLLHDAVRVSVEAAAEEVVVRHVTDGHPAGICRHAAEAALGAWLLRARALAGVALAPLEVAFQHARPADTTEHLRIFGGRVRFAAPRTALVLPSGCLSLPLRTADPALAAILARQADAMLARLPRTEGVIAEVRRAVVDGVTGLEAVARRLATSPRSLQRALAAEGTSLARVADDVRREAAIAHVEAGRLGLAEIAFVLGFSEVSAFHRAFRRWTGRTPRDVTRRGGRSSDRSPPPAARGGGTPSRPRRAAPRPPTRR
jgi:AraC-like DNA-binding protein